MLLAMNMTDGWRGATSADGMADMPAEVMIITGEQTAIEYLTEPIRLSLRRAMKEG